MYVKSKSKNFLQNSSSYSGFYNFPPISQENGLNAKIRENPRKKIQVSKKWSIVGLKHFLLQFWSIKN